MPITKTDKIWYNGKFINWDDATLHVLSHVVSYGSAVFEGIRCYETKQGPAIFRLREHMQRSQALLYIYSRYSKQSKWMLWEIGLFDGLKGAVGIIPIAD